MVNEPLKRPVNLAGSHSFNVETFPVSLRVSCWQMEVSMLRASGFWRILTMAFALGAASSAVAAEDGAWSVSKSSGEVWMTTTGAQQVSLGQEEVLKPGDTIRTGRNGRVLLVRGEETILVSPNSVIGLPTEKKEGLSTTIVQQAGSILLEVEKRNVKHFEVETPYLAAVVKGTQFRVSVNAACTSVDVLRGQVEVADFKSGQIAQVMPGQVATAFAHGKPGLSLSGSGTLNPIEQGKPRASSIERIMVPKAGLSAPAQRRERAAHPRARPRRRLTPAAAERGQCCREARRDADIGLARRSQAEFPQGHPRSRPRIGIDAWLGQKRCEQGYGLELKRSQSEYRRREWHQSGQFQQRRWQQQRRGRHRHCNDVRHDRRCRSRDWK